MKNKEIINNLLKNRKTMILATDKGLAIEGEGGKILSLLEFVISQLNDNGFDKEMLELVFKNALKEPDLTLNIKNNKNLKKALKKMLKGIEKDLDLGDGEDE